MAIAHIKNNMVVNIIAGDDLESLKNHPEAAYSTFQIYDREVHPWGPNGFCDVEVGAGWRTRLKEKLGCCIFCGDGLQVPEQTILETPEVSG